MQSKKTASLSADSTKNAIEVSFYQEYILLCFISSVHRAEIGAHRSNLRYNLLAVCRRGNLKFIPSCIYRKHILVKKQRTEVTNGSFERLSTPVAPKHIIRIFRSRSIIAIDNLISEIISKSCLSMISAKTRSTVVKLGSSMFSMMLITNMMESCQNCRSIEQK